MLKNPFKFGSVVEGAHFTNRKEEIEKICSILQSDDHLILISPRRYGKTSLIAHVIKLLSRPYIRIDLQVITTKQDLASQLLRQLYRLYPIEKLKGYLKSFRVIPTINLNPFTNEIDVSFHGEKSESAALEDVLNLFEKLSTAKAKLLVVFDEFQEIRKIDKNITNELRSILQYHKKVNYIFMGSQESLIRDIFEKKKSPFYHFGYLFTLEKIPRDEFYKFLTKRFKKVATEYENISDQILNFTRYHSYYTQQLAFTIWESIRRKSKSKNLVEEAIEEIVRFHDIDYERLWNTLNRTDMKILIGMVFSDLSPLSEAFSRTFNPGASSTVFSSLKKLTVTGYLVKSTNGYEIDDPFFKRWVYNKRVM